MTGAFIWWVPTPSIAGTWYGTGSLVSTIPRGAASLPLVTVLFALSNGASGQPTQQLVAGVAVTAGMAVAVSRATGKLIPADSGYKPSAFVAGLAVQAATAGLTVGVALGPVTMPDWTAVVGAASLSPGTSYFLGAGGRLTASPTGGACSTFVGTAVSQTTLNVAPQPPIQL